MGLKFFATKNTARVFSIKSCSTRHTIFGKRKKTPQVPIIYILSVSSFIEMVSTKIFPANKRQKKENTSNEIMKSKPTFPQKKNIFWLEIQEIPQIPKKKIPKTQIFFPQFQQLSASRGIVRPVWESRSPNCSPAAAMKVSRRMFRWKLGSMVREQWVINPNISYV